MASSKNLELKKKLGKFKKKNRALPTWVRLKKDSNIRYNSKRRNWRKKKLKL